MTTRRKDKPRMVWVWPDAAQQLAKDGIAIVATKRGPQSPLRGYRVRALLMLLPPKQPGARNE